MPSPETSSDVTLAVLAGGRARRLGGLAKHDLSLPGSVATILENLVSLGTAVGVADVLVVTRPEVALPAGARQVMDLVPNRGAPGGVHAALARAMTPWVLVVACDMPFVTRDALELLLSARATAAPDVEAICFRVGGADEPLMALYRAALAQPLERALTDETDGAGVSLRGFLASRIVHRLPEAALRAIDPTLRALVNINTPGDAARHGLSLPSKEAPNG